MSKWGIDPERDIWSLGVMVQGSGQIGELLGRRRRRRRQLKIGVWNSFSFRAWIGLIWEISDDLGSSVGASCVKFRRASFLENAKILKKKTHRFQIFPGYPEIPGNMFQK